MEKLLETGKAKAIGVCNYSVKYLEELLPHVDVVPAVNQVEDHPYLPQEDLLEYMQSKGIILTAFSPLGSTGIPLFEEQGVQEVAKKHNVSPGTILLSYGGISSSPAPLCTKMLKGHQWLVGTQSSPNPSRLHGSRKISESSHWTCRIWRHLVI